MKLYLISQSENTDYDTYDSAVVCAPDEETARGMHPSNGHKIMWGGEWSEWCKNREAVNVEYLGDAMEGIEQGVICASFNAS